jgi:tRNA A37 methylthiotransferase MiaB
VGETPGLRRVRFTTSHPRDFVKPIIDAIDENPVLCNHVHLPVQSGSSRVLGKMQRQADYMVQFAYRDQFAERAVFRRRQGEVPLS